MVTISKSIRLSLCLHMFPMNKLQAVCMRVNVWVCECGGVCDYMCVLCYE